MQSQREIIKIGNASGYWGDDPDALKRQVAGGGLDYITMDFLAEITMSILQKQYEKDASLGFAKDAVVMISDVLADVLKNKTKIITNAGGINPGACAQAILEQARKQGLQPKIAIVDNDNILKFVGGYEAKGCGFTNMETGELFAPIKPRLKSANVYFGAQAIVEALKRWEPDIILTGRVTDTGISLAPMIYEFSWDMNDFDKLASGIVAGHILECGSQSTGGNFTDWKKIKNFHKIGYPIVEMSRDGSFIVTKHTGSGGIVTSDTVREQLFYEMGNPRAYITPDVVADFSSICLEQESVDRVRVWGVKGFEPTDSYKVSMAYDDGYKAIGHVLVCGPNAKEKAHTFAEIFWKKLQNKYEKTQTEFIGWNSCHGNLEESTGGAEILLRLGVRDNNYKAVKSFSRLIASLILSGPPGVCVFGGSSKIQSVMNFWPALIDKSLVYPRICLYKTDNCDFVELTSSVVGKFSVSGGGEQIATKATCVSEKSFSDIQGDEVVKFFDLCLARTGDKGNSFNLGVMARGPECYKFLLKHLTAQRVKNLFQEFCKAGVARYELESLMGFNFILEDSLAGGGAVSLRCDAQGKMFAQAFLRQKILVPSYIVEEIKSANKQ
jgi:hypothetical protein